MDGVVILVPVLERAHRVAPMIEDVAASMSGPFRLLFIADAGDPNEISALEANGADFVVVPVERRSYACKINDGIRASDEPLIFSAADDLHFHSGWFEQAAEQFVGAVEVVGTNDLGNARTISGEHSTHTLFTRRYIDTQGGVIDQPPGIGLNEGYPHSWVDDEFIGTAKARRVYAHAHDSHVEHMHYLWRKGKKDATYRHGAAGHPVGRALFQSRRHLWESIARADVTIVSAAYGSFDTPRTQCAQDVPVHWLFFTDGPNDAPPPWTTIRAGPAADPRMAAKQFKCLPRVEDCRYAIWVDANMEITSPSFARESIAAIRDGIAVWDHPRRDCIFEEADASLGAEGQHGKYEGMPLLEQVEHYRAGGHPEHGGLFACGTVAWDLHNDRAHELGAAWLAECEKWSPQDQLSFPVVCRRLDITPGVFPLPQLERRRDRAFGNRWLKIHPHSR